MKIAYLPLGQKATIVQSDIVVQETQYHNKTEAVFNFNSKFPCHITMLIKAIQDNNKWILTYTSLNNPNNTNSRGVVFNGVRTLLEMRRMIDELNNRGLIQDVTNMDEFGLKEILEEINNKVYGMDSTEQFVKIMASDKNYLYHPIATRYLEMIRIWRERTRINFNTISRLTRM
jgi:hypothetical protein